jgi:hypothetical protein
MGAVNTTYTFTATDTITSAKMNNIIDETVMTGDAVLGGSGGSGGLDVASGKLSISNGAINSSRLATNSVTSSNIVDGTIVNADINASAAIALSKLATGALPTGITVNQVNITDRSINVLALNGLQTGSAPIYAIRAWASVNGTGSTKRSQNIQSITKPSTGNYTVNFSSDMPASTYAIVTTTESTGSSDTFHAEFYDKLSGSFKIRTSKRDTSGDRTSVDADFDFMVLG